MYKDRFLNVLLEQEVLQFGDFVTKSGRRSPYFFNTGRINNGEALTSISQAYASAIKEYFPEKIENLFGPSYKGIPLACAASMAYQAIYKQNLTYTFNRKEQKAHGEGGVLVGDDYSTPRNILIIEDVLTAGTSLRESIQLLRPYPVKIIGALVGIDRQEVGPSGNAAANDIATENSFPVKAILKLDEIIDRLWNRRVLDKVWIDDAMHAKIAAYRAAYGKTQPKA